MSQELPRPERRTVLLISAGIKYPKKATEHRYTRTDVVEVRPSPKDIERGFPPSMGYAFIFTCTETGVQRRYGLQPARD